MIVVGLTDIHGDLDAIARMASVLESADLALLVGDLTMFGRRHAASEILAAVTKYCPSVLAVHGNCDYPEAGDYLTEKGVSLHGRNQTIHGLTLFGAGGSLPCLGHTPNELPESEFRRLLTEAADGLEPNLPTVLVSHQPPINTALDLANDGSHAGSTSVRACIETTQPLVCFTGHIHEARGIDAIGRTKLVNPGPLSDGRYAYAVIDATLETLEIRTFA